MTVNTGGAEQVEIERLHRKLTNAQANLNTMTELNSNQAATIESMQRCIVSLEGRLTLAKDEAKLHDIAFDAVQARVEQLEGALNRLTETEYLCGHDDLEDELLFRVEVARAALQENE